ncbi:phosphotransferase enzyme family protein [Paenibacillus marinisediminis]
MTAASNYKDEDIYRPIIELVCQAYKLGRWLETCERLGGSYNVSLKIKTDRGQYVVKVLNSAGSEAQLKELQPMLVMLHEAAVPVPVPLTTDDGSCYYRHQDTLIQVTPFVEGVSFAYHEQQVFNSGSMLRLFHDTLQQREFRSKPTRSFYRDTVYYVHAFEKLKANEAIARQELEHAERLSVRILSEWDRIESRLPKGIIHGDWHYWNQLYRESDHEVIAVVDFDYVQEGIRIYDVAYALWSSYILLPRYARTFDRCFLSAYGELTAEEKMILPIAVARIGLYFLYYSAQTPDPIEKWKSQYASQVPLLEWLQDKGRDRLNRLTDLP